MSPASGRKVLIVEDEALLGLQLAMRLRKAGYVVVGPVGSGGEAVESARKEVPDAILMDINLIGDMDGIDAAAAIRDFSGAELIFVTGHIDPAHRERAKALDPAAYLDKPVDIRVIQDLLASWPGSSSLA